MRIYSNTTDEALHMAGTQFIINLMNSGEDDPEMAEIAIECRQEVISMFMEAVEQEKEWATYLFSGGSMIGLNKDILWQYIEYIANIRMSAIGLGIQYQTTTNPIPWVNAWLSSDNVQVAPQESEITSYLVGQIDSTIEENAFNGFEL